MKNSSFCNEGCIDLNSSTLLKAAASAGGGKKRKQAGRMKGILQIIVFYFISTEHLY